MRRSGLVHLLSVSGLHVGLVAVLAWALLNAAGVPPTDAALGSSRARWSPSRCWRAATRRCGARPRAPSPIWSPVSSAGRSSRSPRSGGSSPGSRCWSPRCSSSPASSSRRSSPSRWCAGWNRCRSPCACCRTARRKRSRWPWSPRGRRARSWGAPSRWCLLLGIVASILAAPLELLLVGASLTALAAAWLSRRLGGVALEAVAGGQWLLDRASAAGGAVSVPFAPLGPALVLLLAIIGPDRPDPGARRPSGRVAPRRRHDRLDGEPGNVRMAARSPPAGRAGRDGGVGSQRRSCGAGGRRALAGRGVA